MSLTILRIHPSINPSSGGTYTSIVENTRYLSSKGVETIMLTPSIHPQTPDSDFTWSRSYYFRSWFGPFSFSPSLFKKARWIIKKHKVNYVIIDGLWQYCGIVASALYSKENVSVIQYTHGMLDPFYASQPLKYFRNKIYWFCVESKNMCNRSFVIYTHADEKAYVEKWLFPAKIKSFVQPLGISGSPCDLNLTCHEFTRINPCRLLFLGRIHPKKGIDLLLESIACLDDPSIISLRVVGPVDDSEYKALLLNLVRKYNITSIVKWLTPAYGDQKWNLFNSSDLFVLPTRGENFGLTIPEALSSALPVLCSDKAAIHSFLTDYSAGFVSKSSALSFSESLKCFLSLSPDERSKIRRNAKFLFDEVFSSDIANEKLFQLLANQ